MYNEQCVLENIDIKGDLIMVSFDFGLNGTNSASSVNKTDSTLSPRSQKILNEIRLAEATKESFRENKDGSITKVVQNANNGQILREVNFVVDDKGKEVIRSVTKYSVQTDAKGENPRQVRTTFIDSDGDGFSDQEIKEFLQDGHWAGDAIIQPSLNENSMPWEVENRKMSNLEKGFVIY